MIRNHCGWFAVVCCLSLASSLRADLVNLGALGTITVTANTQSSTITIPIFDSNTAVASNLTAWQLALRVVPLGGSTGTVTIDSTFGYPGSGNILSNPNPSGAPQSNANTPTAGDYTIGAANTGFVPVTVTAGGQNLMTFKVNASAGASGNFALQVVDDGAQSNSYWTDNAFNDTAFNFANTAISGPTQIGTIQVNAAAAVPEPSSMILCGGLAGIAGWRARRKKKAAAAQASTAEPSASSQAVS